MTESLRPPANRSAMACSATSSLRRIGGTFLLVSLVVHAGGEFYRW
jgi:hypothetical protein